MRTDPMTLACGSRAEPSEDREFMSMADRCQVAVRGQRGDGPGYTRSVASLPSPPSVSSQPTTTTIPLHFPPNGPDH